MRKVLVIGRKLFGEKNDTLSLTKTMRSRGESEIDHAYFEDLLFSYNTEQSLVKVKVGPVLQDCASYDLVVLFHWTGDRLYGDIAHALALYAKQHGVEIWNTEAVSSRSTTKLSQIAILQQAGLSIVPTLFSLNTGLLLKAAEISIDFPAVFKSPLASRGRNNFLFKTLDSAREASSSITNLPMLAQVWVPNDKSDLRFLVVGGKVRLVIRRSAVSETHLNNVSAGGKAELVDAASVPAEVIAEVEQVASIFGRELCGIDYMINSETRKYVFLEINGTPQIINGVFADEKVAAIMTAINGE